MFLLTMATPLAFWFAVSVYGFTSKNAVNLFISLCLQFFFAFATTPLYFEAAVEVTYPVPEGVAYTLGFFATCHLQSSYTFKNYRI